MRWVYIPNTNNKYILYENGDVYSLFTYKNSFKHHGKLTVNKKKFTVKIDLIGGICKELYLNKALHEHFQIPYFRKNRKDKLTQEEKIKKNRERVIRWNHSKKGREYRSSQETKDRELLRDRYLKQLIANDGTLKMKDIPYELLEIKRKQICLKRKVQLLKSSKIAKK